MSSIPTVVLTDTKPCYSVGRLENNDFVIDDCTVSRRHASIVKRQGEWYYVDSSLNGSIVNGIIIHGDTVKVNYNTVVRCGGTRFLITIE